MYGIPQAGRNPESPFLEASASNYKVSLCFIWHLKYIYAMVTQFESQILKLLAEEIVPAEGCTEPIALAYCASLVTDALGGRLADRMDVYLSGNMIKNVKSVHIPNAEGKVGIQTAIAMGAILGKSEKKLMVISEVDRSRLPEVYEYAESGRIAIHFEKDCPKLYIRIEAEDVVVEISDFHTRVTRFERAGVNLLDNNSEGCDAIVETFTDRSFLTIDLICKTADSIALEKIEPLFSKVIELNSAIAREGLRGDWGISIGKTIREGIAEGIYGDDLKNNLSSFAAAGSDARMNGCPLPVMTTSGSGNQGMTCSLPVIEFCRIRGLPKETLIRGLFVSHLTTIHIKEVIGRLSAYCGAMAASAGVSGALAYLDRCSLPQIKMAVETTLATISGIICDGAKSSCATKIATGISAAVDAFVAARKGRGLNYGEGIVGQDIEATINHVGTLGADGMKETDEVILDIMLGE